eukprot:18239-Heterococcus_DN1.PRE.2
MSVTRARHCMVTARDRAHTVTVLQAQALRSNKDEPCTSSTSLASCYPHYSDAAVKISCVVHLLAWVEQLQCRTIKKACSKNKVHVNIAADFTTLTSSSQYSSSVDVAVT